jgi:hypothetical protein
MAHGDGSRLRVAVIIAIPLAGTTLSVAQSSADEKGNACSAIEDSLQRLTCFDKAFPKGSVQAEAPSEAAGKPANSAISP